jgi:1,2-diacylglycerol 3-beta-galactosyltransferase
LRLQDLFNLMLKKGWTLGAAQMAVAMHFVIRLFHSKQVHMLEQFWRKSRPDMLVSLIPNFNRAICLSLQAALPGTPLVTVITDLADYPPHFWMEPIAGQHFICGSGKAAEQARAMGHEDRYIHRVSGMVLNPRFYEIPPLTDNERACARVALGFDPLKPVGLVLFGGEGSTVMLDIARRLDGLQLLMICGRNENLRRKLQSLAHTAPLFIEGFTKEIPRYMQLADYFIGKPGPGSISEAVAMGLPVIVELNTWTLPQERYNAEWVREQRVGIVLPNFRSIGRAVEELLEPAAYGRFRQAAQKTQNRAVFEIPGILEQIANAG